MGSQRVIHNWATNTFTFSSFITIQNKPNHEGNKEHGSCNSNAACWVVYMDHTGRHYVIPNLQVIELRQGRPKWLARSTDSKPCTTLNREDRIEKVQPQAASRSRLPGHPLLLVGDGRSSLKAQTASITCSLCSYGAFSPSNLLIAVWLPLQPFRG